MVSKNIIFILFAFMLCGLHSLKAAELDYRDPTIPLRPIDTRAVELNGETNGLVLQAIMKNGSDSIAIISNHSCKLNKPCHGMILRKIEKNSVLLQEEASNSHLKLTLYSSRIMK